MNVKGDVSEASSDVACYNRRMIFEEKYVADLQVVRNDPARLLIDLVPGVIPAPRVGDAVMVHGDVFRIVDVAARASGTVGYRVEAERSA